MLVKFIDYALFDNFRGRASGIGWRQLNGYLIINAHTTDDAEIGNAQHRYLGIRYVTKPLQYLSAADAGSYQFAPG